MWGRITTFLLKPVLAKTPENTLIFVVLAKTGFSKNVVIRPHKNSRSSGLVFLKAESTPLQAMQGGILVGEIFIVNGGDEVGVLEKVEN